MNSGLTKATKIFAAGLILILFVAHQDFWNWGVTERTVGGLPQGFAYHVGLSVVAAFIWWIVTMIAWPKDEWAVSKANQEEPTREEQTKTPSENPGGQA